MRGDSGAGHEEAKAGPKFYKSGPSMAEAGLKVGRQGPAGGEVSRAAVQWFRLHNIDGLQCLNLPWPSAGSNVGHWGVQDEKNAGEG